MKLFLFFPILFLSFTLRAQDSIHVRTMDAVTIRGGKPVIRLSAEKIILNVAASPLAAGGNTYEALLRIPGMASQGELLFRGKKILLLLDGVDTHLSGDDLKTMLGSLPCTGIDRIEVLVTPPARYDAKGAIVVNVISARDKTMGSNASLTGGVRAGQYGGGNGGLSFRYRQRRYNFTGSYDYAGADLLTTSTTNRPLDSLFLLAEEARGRRTSVDQTVRIATEYTPSAKSTLSFQSTLLLYRHALAGNIHDRLLLSGGEVDSNVLTQENKTSDYVMPTFDLGYTYKPDSSGRELTLHAGYVGYQNKTSDRLLTGYTDSAGHVQGAPSTQDYLVLAHNHIGTVSAGYNLPTAIGRIELGGKFTSALTDNRWLPGMGSNDHFIYRENVAAAYISGDRTLGKWTIRAGLRLEQTHTSGHSLSLDSVYVHDYSGLFPTMQVQYQASAGNQWSFAYKRSIERFEFDVVNPFVRYLSPYAYYRGNPDIRPEMEHSLDLSYSYKDALVISANCLYATGVLAEVFQKEGSSLGSSYSNLTHGIQYSLNLAYSCSWLHGTWTSTTSLMGLYARTIGVSGQGFTNAGFSACLESDHSLRLSRGWMAEVAASFTGPLAFGVYRFRSNADLDAGLSKTCCKGRGKFTISLADVFNSNGSRYYIEGMAIGAYNTRKTESRILRVGFSYRFGNNRVAPIRAKQSATGQETQRLSLH